MNAPKINATPNARPSAHLGYLAEAKIRYDEACNLDEAERYELCSLAHVAALIAIAEELASLRITLTKELASMRGAIKSAFPLFP